MHWRPRSVLKRIVRLAFKSVSAPALAEALRVLSDTYEAGTNRLPSGVTVNLSRAWRSMIEHSDPERALCAFEWMTLIQLRASLLAGTILLDPGSSQEARA